MMRCGNVGGWLRCLRKRHMAMSDVYGGVDGWMDVPGLHKRLIRCVAHIIVHPVGSEMSYMLRISCVVLVF